MPVINSTVVDIYENLPLQAGYVESMWFSDLSAQETAFMPYRKYHLTDATFQRETWSFRAPYGIEYLRQCNYIRYLNSDTDNKWYYGFITSLNYVNPNMTEVIFEIDVVQTYMFDWEFQRCFIERETVDDDTFGKHTIPENLEIGPIITTQEGIYDFNERVIVLCTSRWSESQEVVGSMVQGVFSGVNYSAYDTDDQGVAQLTLILKELDSKGLGDKVVGLFMCPKAIWENQNMFARIVIKPNALKVDGYTPYNNKVLCYPYRFFVSNNYQGTENIYRYELFRNPNEFIMAIAGIANLDSSAYCYPMNYAGEESCWREGIPLAGFPQCSWNSNAYANYLAKNKTQLSLRAIGALGDIGSGFVQSIATANPLPGLQSLFGSAQSMAPLMDQSLYPYQIQGQAQNSVLNWNYGRVGFLFQSRSITFEYARSIDLYFSRYGYKVNRLGIPQLNTRTRYNYVKTQGCQITGKMPSNAIKQLCNIFDSGIALFHDITRMGEYGYNPIVNPPDEPTYPEPTIPTANQNPSTPSLIDWGAPFFNWKGNVLEPYGWNFDSTQFYPETTVGSLEGTPIRAIANGTITMIRTTPATGTYIGVSGSSQSAGKTYLWHIYGLKDVTLEVGDKVSKGDIIGAATETTVHNDVRITVGISMNGNTWDPEIYVPNS